MDKTSDKQLSRLLNAFEEAAIALKMAREHNLSNVGVLDKEYHKAYSALKDFVDTHKTEVGASLETGPIRHRMMTVHDKIMSQASAKVASG